MTGPACANLGSQYLDCRRRWLLMVYFLRDEISVETTSSEEDAVRGVGGRAFSTSG